MTHLAGSRGRGGPGFLFVGLATLVIAILIAWPFVDRSLGGDHYIYLARAFVNGNVSVDELSARYGDYATWQGHKYLPFGPLPAVILIPFLPLLHAGMPIAVVGYVCSVFSAAILFRVLSLIGCNREKALWLTLFYFAGSPYLGVMLVGISTFFAQVVATTFMLAAIWAVLKRKPLLAGVMLGMAASARLTELFAMPFFFLLATRRGDNESDKPDLRQISTYAAGLAFPLVLLAAYNLARFGMVTETGFGMARLYSATLEAARNEGLFSVRHVPKNLYAMLVAGPEAVGGTHSPTLRFPYLEPSKWGMSLFLTSPALIYAFMAPWRERLTWASWLAIVGILIPVVTYYGIGYVQFGYRYALDFLPFAMLLVAAGTPDRLTDAARRLIAVSVIVCVWGGIWLAVWI